MKNLELKRFKNIKIPKVFYEKNLIDLIDIHMIILSQVINAISKIKIEERYVSIIRQQDKDLLNELSKMDNEVKNYSDLLFKVEQILKSIVGS